MQPQTEQRLAAEALDRIGRQTLPEADAALAVDGTRYTCKTALANEITGLFRRHPLPLAFGCEIAEPGDYLTLDIAGVPVLLVRADDGTVQGLLNTCRHRGARLLDGTGRVGKAFVCPYHNWAYDRCGVLRAQPSAEHFPDIAVGEAGLVRFPTEERDGLVWLCCSTPPARSTSTKPSAVSARSFRPSGSRTTATAAATSGPSG